MIRRKINLVLAAMAIALLAASCNGLKPDPNSFEFIDSREDY